MIVVGKFTNNKKIKICPEVKKKKRKLLALKNKQTIFFLNIRYIKKVQIKAKKNKLTVTSCCFVGESDLRF